MELIVMITCDKCMKPVHQITPQPGYAETDIAITPCRHCYHYSCLMKMHNSTTARDSENHRVIYCSHPGCTMAVRSEQINQIYPTLRTVDLRKAAVRESLQEFEYILLGPANVAKAQALKNEIRAGIESFNNTLNEIMNQRRTREREEEGQKFKDFLPPVQQPQPPSPVQQTPPGSKTVDTIENKPLFTTTNAALKATDLAKNPGNGKMPKSQRIVNPQNVMVRPMTGATDQPHRGSTFNSKIPKESLHPCLGKDKQREAKTHADRKQKEEEAARNESPHLNKTPPHVFVKEPSGEKTDSWGSFLHPDGRLRLIRKTNDTDAESHRRSITSKCSNLSNKSKMSTTSKISRKKTTSVEISETENTGIPMQWVGTAGRSRQQAHITGKRPRNITNSIGDPNQSEEEFKLIDKKLEESKTDTTKESPLLIHPVMKKMKRQGQDPPGSDYHGSSKKPRLYL